MRPDYTREERRALARTVARGEPLVCPACGAQLAVHEVAGGRVLAYVRRRVLLVCPGCARSAAVDAPRKPGP